MNSYKYSFIFLYTLILINLLIQSSCRLETELKKLQQDTLKANNKDNNSSDKKCTDKSKQKKINESKITPPCDLIVDKAICLFDGKKILQTLNTPKELIAYWSFDEVVPSDSSGNRNHAEGNIIPGNGFGGQGASALFNGNFIKMPYSEEFNHKEYTISFWLFKVEDFFSRDSGNRNCPLLQMGKDDVFSKKYKRSPAIILDRKTNQLKIAIKTSNPTAPEGEELVSNSKVSDQRWLHITVMKLDNKVKLYVNGILDNEILLKNTSEENTSDLYIGGVPWLGDKCKFPFLMDELKFYNHMVSEELIQAEASPVLGGLEPSFIQFGCNDCKLAKANVSCVDGYRLCTSMELHVGGYQIARSMGWLDWNTHIWTYGASKKPEDFKDLKGLALCCQELP